LSEKKHSKSGKVQIIIGSKSDLPIANQAVEILEELGVEFYVNIASAHRTPARVVQLCSQFEERGVSVVIACAGLSAHLPGTVSAHTLLPVIGVPINVGALQGVDALLSIAQMPPGVPVGCMGIGSIGAKNGAILAVQILALQDEGLRKRLQKYRKQQEEAVIEDDSAIGE